ncbi:enoyl-CoA hydratase-related protein [Candidatus Solincola tengchongensis]|uniref:enoyl-CoA hydratase/isomerase family protein n=1 Tax=Candidatus Solincola tengchongensis TaxID=2900693 RepID=UPI00257FC8D9|nr:enoyl-CoA hydratase-related protein [Candidatus Solincola tengchongensis]
MMGDQDELLVEVREPLAFLTINRPERRNALSVTLLLSLARTLKELAEGSGVRCAVLRGAGEKAFSAGMDLTALPTGLPAELQKEVESKGPLQYALEAVEDCPFPVIAMIRGYCVGAGCETSMACDLRVGAEGCRMGMPPARLGIVYPPEGLERFLRNIGYSATRKLFFTAELFGGREAYEMGMLDYLVPDSELETFTEELARRVASNAPLSVSGHKRILRMLSRRLPLTEEEREEANALMGRALSSEDAREGLAAFREKRDPVFRGK